MNSFIVKSIPQKKKKKKKSDPNDLYLCHVNCSSVPEICFQVLKAGHIQVMPSDLWQMCINDAGAKIRDPMTL